MPANLNSALPVHVIIKLPYNRPEGAVILQPANPAVYNFVGRLDFRERSIVVEDNL
jgi:hypothetical protein